MNCVFIEIEQPDAVGRRRVRCKRCRLTLRPTASHLSRINADCHGWPALGEWGYWIALLLEAIGISKRRWWGFKNWLGLVEPRGCSGCEAREKWMNTLGGRIVMAWRRWRT